MRSRTKGIVRPLDPADPRNLNHPDHDEQFFEVARAIGRQMARDERAGLTGPHIREDGDVEADGDK